MKTLADVSKAWHDADHAWHSALVARYGSKATQMRYLVQGQGVEGCDIRKAYIARRIAMQAYMAMQQP